MTAGSFFKGTASSSSKLDTLTVQKLLAINDQVMLFVYEALCAVVVGLTIRIGPSGPRELIPGVLGGFTIGVSQMASCLLRENAVGMSATYEEIGRYFWTIVGNTIQNRKNHKIPVFPDTTIFAVGVVMASWLLLQLQPNYSPTMSLELSFVRASVGGCVMVLGARIAGGCPSGHGITGMSLFSVSSLISVTSMFVGGISLALVL